MKEKKIIPVVFASNDGYAPYLGVALHSLIKHSNPDNEYHVYILYSEMKSEHQRKLELFSCEHVKVSTVNISSVVTTSMAYKTNLHFTVEANFRFYIPEIFSQYGKVLYLDCDIVVFSDVAELFSTDLNGSVLGVGESIVPNNGSLVKHVKEDLNVSFDQIFNSGILLINTTEFTEGKIKEKCLDLIEEDCNKETPILIYPDQDALTLICQERLTRFSMKWNYEWQFGLEEYRKNLCFSEDARRIYKENARDIKILHYSSDLKPWAYPELPLADIFWQYAKETDFYEEILIKETRTKLTNVEKKLEEIELEQKIHQAFPWEKVKAGSTIVVYGAGLVGQDYMRQLAKASYCFVAAVCDKNAAELLGRPYRVVTPKELATIDFDALVIAVLDDEIADKIKKELISLGVAEEKIIWDIRTL